MIGHRTSSDGPSSVLAPNSDARGPYFLFLVAMPGAPSSVLVPSSNGLHPSSNGLQPTSNAKRSPFQCDVKRLCSLSFAIIFECLFELGPLVKSDSF